MERGTISMEENKVVIKSIDGTVWLTQSQIADLFECFTGKVSSNIRAILKTGVLDEREVCKTHHYKNGNFVEIFNLEMITALSFRIKSRNAGLFRSFIMKKAVANAERPILMIRDGDICNFYLN